MRRIHPAPPSAGIDIHPSGLLKTKSLHPSNPPQIFVQRTSPRFQPIEYPPNSFVNFPTWPSSPPTSPLINPHPPLTPPECRGLLLYGIRPANGRVSRSKNSCVACFLSELSTPLYLAVRHTNPPFNYSTSHRTVTPTRIDTYCLGVHPVQLC